MSQFKKELENLINRNCLENGSNTPDFILAEYLNECLQTFDKYVTKRDNWHGNSSSADHVDRVYWTHPDND